MNKNQFDAKAEPGTLSSIDPQSVCVVGSGPVGLAFALRLANAGKAVTVIDSGKFAAKDQGHEFFCGTVASAADAADRTDPTLVSEGTLYSRQDYMTYSRYLGSGGNSCRWGVEWRPAAEGRVRIVPGALADFDARPEFDIPAWAAPGIDVYSRYRDALDFFALEGHNFDIGGYQDDFNPVPLSTFTLPTKLFHFARSKAISQQRVAEAKAHPGITVCSDLHLVRIETNKQETVTGLVMCRPDGSEVRIQAGHYVLALGGIENARQLLLAKQDGALADPHDVFGRWFVDHPHTRLGYLTDPNPDELLKATAWYDFQEVAGTPIMRGHEIQPEIAQELGILRFSIDLVGRPVGDSSKTGVAVAQAWDRLKRRDRKGFLGFLPQLAADPIRAGRLIYEAWNNPVHNTGKGGWSDPAARYHSFGSVSVEAMFEQRPSPDNRVRLGTNCDRLGRQLPVLQWSWSQKETESINRAADFVADAFKQSGVGSFVTMRELGQGDIPRAGSGFHHMGGTRQSVNPSDGVVNAENRMHGVDNLTLIGTSVFPNSVGYANPTLTAVADAIRVADIFSGVAPRVAEDTPFEAFAVS
ncbi:GMC oxidoreductase [Leptothoe kymatousa]|uniref:GMC family oxidoreductase n=1 Tax=Leptothoe kymatousa TAU-MAC 1615 TaxID=2364775 RepID=A0ABS5Y5S5_9CYAN|nr:GMC oxidoreductase [Leptothoe kymatousa]MBT9313162.1 GMC family oxidoreductase [Leptothoe kymatousa TAU-MAC 1615]